jgi:hypothetical protein
MSSVGPIKRMNGAISESPNNFTAALEGIAHFSALSPTEDSGHDRETDTQMDSVERKVKAEAKSNRKVGSISI